MKFEKLVYSTKISKWKVLTENKMAAVVIRAIPYKSYKLANYQPILKTLATQVLTGMSSKET